MVERRNFIPFLRHNDDLYLRLLAVLCERLRRTSVVLEELALLEFPARLARLLLKFADNFGQPDGRGVRIQLKLVAWRLGQAGRGLGAELVAKELKKWEREGLLRQERAGYYVVVKAGRTAPTGGLKPSPGDWVSRRISAQGAPQCRLTPAA